MRPKKKSVKVEAVEIRKVTYRTSWMFARSLELRTCRHISRLSSKRLSKQLTGARKMMELMLSKWEHQACRYYDPPDHITPVGR